MRNAAWRVLRATGMLDRAYAPMLAGWRARYPDVLFGGRGGKDKLAGRRAPHWRPEPGGTRFRLLTRGSDVNSVGAELAGRYPDLVTHEEIATGRPGFLLIRPDASGGPQDLHALERHLDGLRPKAVTGQ